MLALKAPVPCRPVSMRRVVRPKAITFQEGVELTGKSIGLFVLFTSTMNWWFYRKVRKQVEDENKKP